MSGRQPIETWRPEDGTDILVWSPKLGHLVVQMTFSELPIGTPFTYAHKLSGRYLKVSDHYAEQKGRKTPTMIRSDATVVPIIKRAAQHKGQER